MKPQVKTTLCMMAITGSLVLLLSGGCSKKPVIPPDTSMTTTDEYGKTISYPSAEGGGYSEENLPIEGSLDDTATTVGSAGTIGGMAEPTDEYKMLHGRSSEGLSPIYFNFDQAIIRPDMVERMVSNSDYLLQLPNSNVIIEGNTDERGTNEYNLALAERRAQNTKQYLIELGVSSTRIRTVSYGEEKPLFLGQDEESYAKNRRADFILE